MQRKSQRALGGKLFGHSYRLWLEETEAPTGATIDSKRRAHGNVVKMLLKLVENVGGKQTATGCHCGLKSSCELRRETRNRLNWVGCGGLQCSERAGNSISIGVDGGLIECGDPGSVRWNSAQFVSFFKICLAGSSFISRRRGPAAKHPSSGWDTNRDYRHGERARTRSPNP